MSKENFNEMMKRAFTENKAIGFTAYKFTTGGESLHAMTIWGAEFDEEGYVSHIYYCLNLLAGRRERPLSRRLFWSTCARISGSRLLVM